MYLGNCSNNIIKFAGFTRKINAVTLNSIGIAVKGNDSVEDMFSPVSEQDNIINLGGTVQRGKCDFILTVPQQRVHGVTFHSESHISSGSNF